jgi:hypothetical protein
VTTDPEQQLPDTPTLQDVAHAYYRAAVATVTGHRTAALHAEIMRRWRMYNRAAAWDAVGRPYGFSTHGEHWTTHAARGGFR